MALGWFNSLFRSPFGRMLAFILLIFTLIPVLALFVFGTVIIRGQLENRSIAQLQTITDLNQTSLSQWTTEASDALQNTLEDPVVIQNALFVLQSASASRSMEVLVQDLTELTEIGYFSRVYLIRPDGGIVLSTVPDLEVESLGINIDELAQNDVYFWGFSEGSSLGYATAFTWRPLQDRRQTVIGYLVGEFNLETISNIITQSGVTVGETVSTHLVTADGVELTPKSSSRWTDETLTGGTGLTRYSGMFTEPGGASVIGNIQPLTAQLQAWIIVTQHTNEVFNVLYDITPIAIVFVIALTVLAILVTLPTTHRIVSPLQNLQKAAQEMAGGNLKTRVDIQRKDEFGSLAVSFNHMANELQQAFGRLENTNAALSKRADQLATITHVGQLATQFLGLDELLATVTREIRDVFNYDAVIIYLPDADQEKLIASAASGANTEMVVGLLTWDLEPTTSIGVAAIERRTVVNVIGDNQYATSALHMNIKSEVNIPLVLGGQESQLIGMFSIQSEQPDAFTNEDVEVLEIFADQLAIAIRNAELFDESEHARHLADLANQQKSEFLSNMSHELRTPLNVIIGYSHSILNRPAMYQNVPLPPVYAQSIESIMTSGQHLLGLINDILDLSKIEAGRIDLTIEPIAPLPLLTGVRATALGLVKEGVNLYTSYPDKLPNILGDELRVRQILLNLISNAAKFTEHGSITLGARVQGTNLLFWVADTGSGIPAEAQPALFERFQQVSSQRLETRINGTGLGLSISRELTRLQGGEIWFTSKVGEGTTFYFTIPLAEGREDKITAPTLSATETSGRVSIFEDDQEALPILKQILLVDPRSETRKLLYDSLTGMQYDVLAESSPDEVVTLASALLPDALVLHIHEASDEMERLIANLQAEEAISHIPLLVLRNTGLTGKSEADKEIVEKIFTQISDAIDAKSPAKP